MMQGQNMHISPIKNIILTLLFMLSGCSSYHYDYAPIDPPEQNQWITIRGTLPPHVTGTLVPKYYSSICMRPRPFADGSVGTEGRISNYEITIQPKSDGRYQGRVYLHGGSRCDWKLYDILFFSEPESIAPYQEKLPITWQSIIFDSYAVQETVQVFPASTEQPATANPLRLEASYYPNFAAAYDSDGSRNLSLRRATDSPNLRRSPKRFIYPVDGRTELGIIDFSPTVDMNYVIYTKYIGTRSDKNLKPNKNYRKETHYPNGDVSINEPDDRPYRYYEKKKERKWWDDIE